MLSRIGSLFKAFVVETAERSKFEVVDIFECQNTGFIRAVLKLSARHTIEKNISDVITDNELLEGLDKKTIRTLTYMATVEKMKPDYSIMVQQLSEEVDEYLLKIKAKSNTVIIKTPSELSKDKSSIVRFNSLDANRIGYLAGVRETVKEFQMRNEKK